MKYLGEFNIQMDLTRKQWIMKYIESYSQIDGSHHKQWVLDQIARILNGAEIITKEAQWSGEDGSIYTELSFSVGTSQQYENWVISMKNSEDGPETYSYDAGIAP